ncbi:hypothetical protein BP5796_08767 [Coleophoma crateriformis]|uniref:DUF7908 domain-containing protein n=1 Tax=Coleophoma crateriformis TaxID=565419 RepID=A0A3D8R8T6_9HELO|nr:hypothetical protein BP5796_08767 [Coleophoma crateriformis]
MFSPALLATSLLLAAIPAARGLDTARRDHYCVNGSGVVEIESPLVSYKPVFINSYIAANTIININGGVVIDINNAPTFLSTVVTATVLATTTATLTSTVTARTTVTKTSSTVVETVTITPSTFVIQVVPIIVTKRQQGNNTFYLTASAALVQDNNLASLFTIINQELFSGGQKISTTFPGNSSALFQVGGSGNITTTFSNVGNVFMWNNPAFTNGAKATFCLLGEILHVIFDGSSIDSCVPASLYSLPSPSELRNTSSIVNTSTSQLSASSSFTDASSSALKTVPSSTAIDSSTTTPITSTPACTDTQLLCEGVCVNQTESLCGSCTNSCVGHVNPFGQAYLCDTSLFNMLTRRYGACASVSLLGGNCNDAGGDCGSDAGLCSPAGYCIYEIADTLNCGVIGNICVEPYGTCNWSCVDLQTDSSNCGAVASQCAQEFGVIDSCAAGTCVSLVNNATNCGACPTGATCSSGTCINLAFDANNCGAFGNVCPSAAPSCVKSQCVDLNVDTSNCGYIGDKCNPNETCQSGLCICGTSDGT